MHILHSCGENVLIRWVKDFQLDNGIKMFCGYNITWGVTRENRNLGFCAVVA